LLKIDAEEPTRRVAIGGRWNSLIEIIFPDVTSLGVFPNIGRKQVPRARAFRRRYLRLFSVDRLASAQETKAANFSAHDPIL